MHAHRLFLSNRPQQLAVPPFAGDVERELDPYFPFEGAVDAWARCFAALGIQYRGATMRLDLCDRPGKYSNGFCHWPQVPHAPEPKPELLSLRPPGQVQQQSLPLGCRCRASLRMSAERVYTLLLKAELLCKDCATSLCLKPCSPVERALAGNASEPLARPRSLPGGARTAPGCPLPLTSPA